MGVTIHKIQEKNESLRLTVELAEKSDYKVLQALFRDCISSRLSIESSFGLDKNMREKDVLGYPIGIVFDLIYDSVAGKVGITWKKNEALNKDL
jgi:hypothetical protein